MENEDDQECSMVLRNRANLDGSDIRHKKLNYPAGEVRGIKNQKLTVLGADYLIYRRITVEVTFSLKTMKITTSVHSFC
jgi:hypothetical protein